MYDKMKINGKVIHRGNKIKYLGPIIDEKLSWKDSIDYLVAPMSKFYGIFNKIKHFLIEKNKSHVNNL